MKVAIFGASGGIGKSVVKHALEQGYEVNAYVRNPEKLGTSHEHLNVIVGQVAEYDKIKQAISGCDAVISVLGIPMKSSYTNMDSLMAHENMIKAMQEVCVSRLIDWATPSAKCSHDTRSFITVVPGLMASILFPKAKKEIISVCDTIQKSGLEWTIVRFMAPKDTAYTGNVKVGFGDKKMNFEISREDIAAFMLEQVKSKEYIRSMPIIGS